MYFSNITYPDVNNGLGCRVTLWVSGCKHMCPNCHNQETWDFKYGREFTEDDEKKLFDLIDKPYIKGLTISGGDPIYSVNDGLSELLIHFREKFGTTKDIWLYSGFYMDYIQHKFPNIINLVDVVVDGVYVHYLKDTTLKFRGSSNQTIWEKDKEGNFFRSSLND